ncbi:putative lipase/hydrolase [Desulforapulum autotrophicum HRM2]|uniref:Lipase/hydrolase n=1 Tax=Desulforapulum autotrophicum (strain ATCC 43914 / DSM 3382 / VKM B-1955 / HRM2) TaxID=177437 RepID=C0QFP2_DESAH|nr:arylesterase [Desulforapulum autotrophicum]ACN15460.1 putative lipase/hydrolase [Desulforapulum autotrophicum HRM2]
MKPLPFLLAAIIVLAGIRDPLSARESVTRILFVGDSITAGFGVDPEQSYPVLVDQLLRQKGFNNIEITNGSISGSTTASALSRLKWFLRIKPHILVLALGANDGLRGLSTVEMEQNLDRTILLALENGIQVILAGMEVPPNYGPRYSAAFRKVFPSLASHHNIALIPFLLKDVAGIASLNQADGIHPNQAGQEIIATTVLPYLLDQL